MIRDMRGVPSTVPNRSATDLVIIGTNLLPLAGIVYGDWNVWTLLLLYWIEAFSTVLFGVLKSLFAKQGSPDVVGEREPLHELRHKRGGWRPLSTLPPIYPRNVPFALSILGIWASTILPITILFWVLVETSIALSWEVAVSVGALIVAHGIEFHREYLGAKTYKNVSAREILQQPSQLTLGVMFLGIIGLSMGQSAGVTVLGGFVIVKTILAVSWESTGPIASAFQELFDRLSADREFSRSQPELSLPDEPVEARVTVSPQSVLLGSSTTILLTVVNRGVALLLAGVVAAIVTARFLWVGIGLTVLLGIFIIRAGSYYFRYGTIEYQRRGEMLVAYDTVLDAPQWLVPIHSRARFEIKNAIPDRLFGTGTLQISNVETAPTNTVQFGPVADLDHATETLDLPIRHEERPEQDPAVVGAALVLALVFLSVPLLLLGSPQVSGAEMAAVMVLIAPFFMILLSVLIYAMLARI
ncbi:DUF6498-containing protein [Halorubrum ezzemoulense]|uniref:DUF6498-containing protein n=1 Tax=Halorubrum ezzemoulense TaxID=337243 RepID=UPI00232EDECB|nr:DUF6498-containing protein [Halorubrum ezzemoulense]MDB9235877.1 DUF6498-containing protein [Halorubrum ezzemoulense]